MSKDTGGAAFPCEDADSYYSGMTLRDYFAAKAMQAFMSWSLARPQNEEADTRQKAAAHYARVAYEIADAMLKERVK